MLLGRGIIDLGGFSPSFGFPQQQGAPMQPVQRAIGGFGQFDGGLSMMPQPIQNQGQVAQPSIGVSSPVHQEIPTKEPVMTTLPVQQPQPQVFAQPVGKQLPMSQIQPISANAGVEMSGNNKTRGGVEFISPIKTLPVAQSY